jgi:hypothetical protein
MYIVFSKDDRRCKMPYEQMERSVYFVTLKLAPKLLFLMEKEGEGQDLLAVKILRHLNIY